jgi:hypothetical protein
MQRAKNMQWKQPAHSSGLSLLCKQREMQYRMVRTGVNRFDIAIICAIAIVGIAHEQFQ